MSRDKVVRHQLMRLSKLWWFSDLNHDQKDRILSIQRRIMSELQESPKP